MTPERFAKLKQVLQRRQPDLTLVAENARNPQNLAALRRTCDAVGVLQMHAVSEQLIRRHHMVAAGSGKWLPLKRHQSMAAVCDELRDQGFQILAAHQSRHAVDFRDVDYTRPSAIVLGGELWGVSATAAVAADRHITVPMHGQVRSLNVSVAAALVLYEAMRQREAVGYYESSRLDPLTYQRLLFDWTHPGIARRCRQLGLPYPALDDDGNLLENPFARAEVRDSSQSR
ncbi:MAG: tRNA (guanosine(18)-2'-O)-methyltransferase TrmH [Gammaproteobacteria bacterium]|nr:tRNA (guanosine(18)-2'-O)-methyltransferase TrmH [Gammaproteobacteria bacterium]